MQHWRPGGLCLEAILISAPTLFDYHGIKVMNIDQSMEKFPSLLPAWLFCLFSPWAEQPLSQDGASVLHIMQLWHPTLLVLVSTQSVLVSVLRTLRSALVWVKTVLTTSRVIEPAHVQAVHRLAGEL